MHKITEIKGIGPALAKACVSQGYESVEKIAAADVADIETVRGVSEKKAGQLIDSAKSLLNGASTLAAATATDTKSNLDGNKRSAGAEKKNKTKNTKKKKKIDKNNDKKSKKKSVNKKDKKKSKKKKKKKNSK